MEAAGAVLVYLVILVVTVAGMLQAGWWAALIGALILALLSVAERSGASLSAKGYYAGLLDDRFASAMAALNATAASTTAFIIGRATTWLWGL